MNEITGHELLAKSIAAQGIRYTFSVPSPRLTPFLDSLRNEEVIQIILANSETAAAAMADGYARRTRKSAVVITEGKGSALAQISAVTNAWADKIPMISISLCTDEAPDFNKGVDRERFDQNAVFQPVTQWRKRALSIREIPELLEESIQRSSAHKMGPVHLDIPAGLLQERIDAGSISTFFKPGSVPEKSVEPLRISGDQDGIQRASDLIMQAKRPLLFLGGGINASEAHQSALFFMQNWRIPTATTMAGIGAVPIEHELCLGGPSYAAGETFHVAIREADVVLAIGVSFGGLEGFGLPPMWSDEIKFIQVDISPYQFGLNVSAEVSILGDARTVLEQLSARLSEMGFSGRPHWDSWCQRLQILKKGRNQRLRWDANYPCDGIHQGRVALEMANLPNLEDILVVIDGGNTPLYSAMYAPITRPFQAFFPFGMAALGAGIPYAIGVQLAAPDKRVVLMTGDGSFMYNLQELETIKRLKLPIVIIVNNDSAWNMIRAMQESLFARNFLGTDLPNSDYAKIASGFGLWSKRITRPEEVQPAYEQAIASGEPALIDCVTDKRNLPDSLLSFALVEFQGSLTDLHPIKLLKSLWMMRDKGMHRTHYMLEYIVKALLRINPAANVRGLR